MEKSFDSRMQQILQKCSEYSKNRLHIRPNGLWEYGHGQQFEQFVGSLKMYCIIGFELVCIFPTLAAPAVFKILRSKRIEVTSLTFRGHVTSSVT